MLAKKDLVALSSPSAFALAESDAAFPENMVAAAKGALDGRIPHELIVYPGTCHGFAARGDLSIESVRKGAEGAHAQAVAWFRKYLL
jgi:carboxymethylenebutenolidase